MKTTLLVSCLASLVLPGLASPETDLEAKLPEIFAKSAAHYKALDAAATPLMKVRRKSEEGKSAAMGEDAWEYRTPHGWIRRKNGTGEPEKEAQPSQGASGATRKERTGELDMRSIYWWTSGHFPGSLWYLYEATGDAALRDRATVWTEILAPVSKYTANHDIGFMMYCSYGNARRILKTDKYDALLVETANSLCQRYNGKLGLIRSWGQLDETENFLVIPDNLMNLELLEFAAGAPSGRPLPAADGRARSPSAPLKPEEFDRIARSHADVTMKNHFRADGGCYHVLNYDQRPAFLGQVQEIRRGQGLCVGTAWSRGQAWGIYGYTMMYRATGLVRYLDFAKKLADYAIDHPNMPADGIPYWDFGAPGEERDSSAGAVMASALLELSQYVSTMPETQTLNNSNTQQLKHSNTPTTQTLKPSNTSPASRYRSFAVKQLTSLASPAYFSEGDEIGHFLLKHGTGHKPGNSEVDTPLDYGDYYFLEALLRFRSLRARERSVCGRIRSLARDEDVASTGGDEFGAPGGRPLPEKAQLPPDELSVRSRVTANAVAIAEKALAEPIPDTSDELYGEFWTTGNRTHYEKQFFARLRAIDALATVIADESSDGAPPAGRARTPAAPDSSSAGRARSTSAPSPKECIARLEDYLDAICSMKSWVLPAHDWSLGGKGTFRGEWISTDLLSTEVAAHLACIVQLLGPNGAPGGRPLPEGRPTLRPETVARVKAECERRVFGPVRRELSLRLFPEAAIDGVRVANLWWMNCGMNWNAVCWDNIVCAACGLIDDGNDRALFIAAADKAADIYIEHGFAEDGYCSEGMGYWNYGFGHHLMTGRLLSRLTRGKLDFFRCANPAASSKPPYQRGECRRGECQRGECQRGECRRGKKERLAAAYARAYTLASGVSPAFADGNGAADPKLLKLVDEFWPDLPKTLPPTSEFPDGQVWLFRDPEGLSVAFKGGHNDELHNHNDIGSYYIVADGKFLAGDPGGEVYTRRTFSPQRYDSKVLNSYGHPVPVVGGQLQGTGRKFAARVLSVESPGNSNNSNHQTLNNSNTSEVTLDLTGAYDVKTLKKLTRTFVCNRASKTFAVRDHVEFSAPTAFESPFETYLEKDNPSSKTNGGKALVGARIRWNVRPTVSVKGGAYDLVEEDIPNPNRIAPHRVAVRLKEPVTSADVEFVFAHGSNK